VTSASTVPPSEASTTDFSSLASVAGRVAIVTGAGQGIGRVLASALAANGAVSVIAELNAEKANAVAGAIRRAGGRALALAADVANPESVELMARRTFDEFGRIDVLINNAGILSTLKMRPFCEIPLEEWESVLRVNVTGVMLACRAVVPFMQKAKWGRIINMSSASVLLGRPNYLHYTTSKAALIGMTRSMARELGGYGITVNALMPGAIQTEIPRETVTPEQRQAITAMQCIQRVEVPEDIIGAVLFLASEGSRFMTGQTMNVDGGAAHI